MTPTTRKALEMALDALEYHTQQTRPISRTEKAIVAITEALAEPAPRRLTRQDIDDLYQKEVSELNGWDNYARAIEARIFGDVK